MREEGVDLFLSDSTAYQLEGLYRVDTNARYYDVYAHIQNKMPKAFSNPQDMFVKIKVLNEKELELSYYRQCKSYRKRKLKGEFQDGYFRVKNKFEFFKPYFPIIYGPATIHRKLGKSKSGNLVYTKSELGYIMLLIAPLGKGLSLKDYEFVPVPESEIQDCASAPLSNLTSSPESGI